MGPLKTLFLILPTLYLEFLAGAQASLCGSYQRDFCLRKLKIFIGRGGGTYSGIAKLGPHMVDGMCGYFQNNTVPCLSDMRSHCNPEEEADLQGEIDVQEYLCDEEGQKELLDTAECLSLVEENTHDCAEAFEASRLEVKSLVTQLKVDAEGAKQRTCQAIYTQSECAYGKVSGCGPQHAQWMRSIYDKKTEALRLHFDCSGASGLSSIAVAGLVLVTVLVTFSGF